jgi:deoxyribose-phosphate aldolase
MSNNFDETRMRQRIQETGQHAISGLSREDSLKLILSCLDLTTLEGSDHDDKVSALCGIAGSYAKIGLPNVAAVCVYPTFARLVRKKLQGSGVKTACVAGAFPSGQSSLKIRLDEVKYAVDEGAEEIDMVISRGRFLQGDFDFIAEEVSSIKEACGEAHLKVILETGELGSLENIRKASDLAIGAGADFIKTSTGKIQPAATPEAVWVMLEAIRDHFMKTGKKLGIKPAGGIAEPEQAILYANLVHHILGAEWLNNQLFRIGASRLADNILNFMKR